jgi:hypothetical protein
VAVLTLELLGTKLDVETNDERWASLTRQLWEPFVVDEGPADGVIQILKHQDGWRLHFNKEPPIESDNPWFIANQFRYTILEYAADRDTQSVGLHAAALQRGDELILLVGQGTVGKTTLAIALAGSGWSLLTDDFAPITAGGVVQPFPKPLGIKDPKRWDDYRAAWRDPDWPPRPLAVFLVPASFVSTTSEPGRPTSIFFPSYAPEERPLLRTLTSAEATARCSEHVFPITGEKLQVIAAVCRKAPAHQTRYRDTSEAIDQVERVLTTANRP